MALDMHICYLGRREERWEREKERARERERERGGAFCHCGVPFYARSSVVAFELSEISDIRVH
jgi:hypothetical protein